MQEEAEIKSFEAANQEYVSRSLKLVRLMGMLWPTLEFMLGLAMVLVLWIGGREVFAGRMEIGGFHGIHDLHDAVDISRDRAGLGGQYFSAGNSVSGASERDHAGAIGD